MWLIIQKKILESLITPKLTQERMHLRRGRLGTQDWKHLFVKYCFRYSNLEMRKWTIFPRYKILRVPHFPLRSPSQGNLQPLPFGCAQVHQILLLGWNCSRECSRRATNHARLTCSALKEPDSL